MDRLAIQNVISSHSDWEKLLPEAPYRVNIKRDKVLGRDLVIFKYNLVDEPDFSIPLVKECRGLILDGNTFEVVSYPFDKFFNYGEPHAAEIDWNTASVGTKIDGSIIKIVRLGDDLLISTNGCIDAYKTDISQDQAGCPFKSYGEIVQSVLEKKFGTLDSFRDKLNEGYTYMFELVSPFTKVVIPYPESDMYLIGCRDNRTFKETFYNDCPLAAFFKTPEIHQLRSVADCLAVCEKMPWNEEGYVVVDGNFNRIKIKSFAYLAVHRLANNGVMTRTRAIELIRTNEVDEVLAYFPEHRRTIDAVKADIAALTARLNGAWIRFEDWLSSCGGIPGEGVPRKDVAMKIMDDRYFGKKYSGIGFALFDGKIESVGAWLDSISPDKLAQFLGYK